VAFRSAADPKFKQRLEGKSPKDQAAILGCIAQILEDPRHIGLRTEKLRGAGVFYSRATRSKRVTWEWGEQDTIVFRNHCDHDEVPRSP
jgi:hypothetical protein